MYNCYPKNNFKTLQVNVSKVPSPELLIIA